MPASQKLRAEFKVQQIELLGRVGILNPNSEMLSRPRLIRGTGRSLSNSESLPCANRKERTKVSKIRFERSASMLMTKDRLSKIRTLHGWAISVLHEAHAIRECEYHGWVKDRADPHAREHAFAIARHQPAPGLSPDAAEAELREVLDSVGDECPECPPE